MRLPHKFGKYVLTAKIAQGGMAEIYRAKYLGESGFEKEVAVKRILPVWSENKSFVTMLCDEAKALVNLQHQNIVQVYELGRDGEAFFISMEYVEGVDARRLFQKIMGSPRHYTVGGQAQRGSPTESRGGALSPPESDLILPLKFTCFIISEILKALDFAHNKKDKNAVPLGIIHRDVSPQNVLLSFNGEVKVADFGIAKGAHRQFETTVVQVKGKYAYMSPEQAVGQKVDARTDIYAVGVIFFELLTSKRLYFAPNDLLTIEQVKKSALPENWDEDIPQELSRIVKRSLEREPEKRFQSAGEFLTELNKYVVANDLVTNSIEFSAYLKNIFYKEYEEIQSGLVLEEAAEQKPQTKILSIISKTVPEIEKGWHTVGRYKWLSAMMAAIFLGSSPTEVGHPSIAPTTPPAGGARVGRPNIVPTEVGRPEEVGRPASAGGIGILNVQARPWGYVYLDGYLKKEETPVMNVKLKAGEHFLKVHYEPTDKWLQQKVKILANSKTICIADFESSSAINCRVSTKN